MPFSCKQSNQVQFDFGAIHSIDQIVQCTFSFLFYNDLAQYKPFMLNFYVVLFCLVAKICCCVCLMDFHVRLSSLNAGR